MASLLHETEMKTALGHKRLKASGWGSVAGNSLFFVVSVVYVSFVFDLGIVA